MVIKKSWRGKVAQSNITVPVSVIEGLQPVTFKMILDFNSEDYSHYIKKNHSITKSKYFL